MKKRFVSILFISCIFSQSVIDTLSVTIYPEYYYQGIMVEYKFDTDSSNQHQFILPTEIDSVLYLVSNNDELFEEVDLSGLVENKGIIYFWTDKDLKSRELEIKVRDELGVEQQLVTKAEIHDLEPHIKPFYHAGVYYPYARHARNPRKIFFKYCC